MKQSEIDYFLDGVVVKQQMIESIEGLRDELARAMQPMFEPKLKETHPWDQQTTDMSQVYNSDANLYQKAVLVYMHLNRGPQTMQQIADATSMSITSVKRVINHYMAIGDIMRAPFQPGYILTQFA